MATPIGRPVSPTYTSATPPATRVAPPATSSPALETSKPVQTQESFAAARQSVVGKGTETVNPSQGGAQVKQGIDQVEPDQLLEQGQGLMESPVVKSEFGISEQPSSSPSPQKAVYALGDDSTVVGSAQSLSEKQGHTAMNQSQLRSLGSEDKLILVGHGDDHRFGGMDAEQLAGHLKEAGVTSLKKISLKGCNSADFAIKLFSALQKQGIEVECITGKTGNAVIAKNGRTLVEQDGQMLHQAVGNTIEVTKAGVKYKHEGDEAHSVEAVKGRSSEIEGLGHDGALGKLNDGQIDALVTKHAPSYDKLTSKNIRNIEANIMKNGGKFVSTAGLGQGPAWAEAIAAEIIQIHQQQSIGERKDSVERYMYLQVQRPGTCDGDAIKSLTSEKFVELRSQTKDGLIPVDFKQILLGKNITCHEFAYDKIDTPGYKPDCQAVLSKADETGKPYAVCFLDGRVAHSAFQEDGVWHQALKVGDGDSDDAATAFFTTKTMEIGNYRPVLIYDPSITDPLKPGSKANFIKVWEEQEAIVSAAILADVANAKKARESADKRDVMASYNSIDVHCNKGESTKAMEIAKEVCRTFTDEMIGMILTNLEPHKTKEHLEIIQYIQENRPRE